MPGGRAWHILWDLPTETPGSHERLLEFISSRSAYHGFPTLRVVDHAGETGLHMQVNKNLRVSAFKNEPSNCKRMSPGGSLPRPFPRRPTLLTSQGDHLPTTDRLPNAKSRRSAAQPRISKATPVSQRLDTCYEDLDSSSGGTPLPNSATRGSRHDVGYQVFLQ